MLQHFVEIQKIYSYFVPFLNIQMAQVTEIKILPWRRQKFVNMIINILGT